MSRNPNDKTLIQHEICYNGRVYESYCGLTLTASPRFSAVYTRPAPHSARHDDATTRRRDDATTRRRDDATTRRRDDATTRRRDDATTRRRDDATTRRRDDATTRRRDDTTTRRHDFRCLQKANLCQRCPTSPRHCPAVADTCRR